MNPFEKISPAEKSLQDLKTFYKKTGKLDELKALEGPLVPVLPEKYLKMLKSIDLEMVERTMKKIKTIFAPPFPFHVEPEDILSPDELKNLVDALAIAAYDQKFLLTGAVAIENKIADNQILEPKDIELLEKSIEDFKKYV
ncbi:MAG: hypothetical protein WCW31_00900 [Patescibacteria group bacterium]|jgi:hypothetical protein